ncbi:200_t:CDS:2 [Entrophospora sp. SA101]|nr:200_t:CDS:2 [Entrophospora sp. SA101]
MESYLPLDLIIFEKHPRENQLFNMILNLFFIIIETPPSYQLYNLAGISDKTPVTAVDLGCRDAQIENGEQNQGRCVQLFTMNQFAVILLVIIIDKTQKEGLGNVLEHGSGICQRPKLAQFRHSNNA